MLRRLREEYNPAYYGVIFDAKGKTFRNDLYPLYKANRPPMPDELRMQIEPLHALIRALGLPLISVPQVEADDVIGTLARLASLEGLETIISTGDKDLAQLVDEQVRLINTMNDSVLDHAGVEKKFGVPPELIVDYLALMGDTSDNVPGVPKVGPKTAAKWLNQYGSLEQVIEHADEIKGKVGQSLRDSLDQLALSRELVTIKCDVDLEQAPRDLMPTPIDTKESQRLFKELEFKTWLNELLATTEQSTDDATQPTQTDLNVETILTQADLGRWIEKLAQSELIAFDTETTSLDYMQARIVGVSFAVEEGHAAYCPLAHDYPGAPQQLSRDQVLTALKPILEDPSRPKLGHNLKYDMSVLANHEIRLAGITHDSMLASYVLDSTATRHNMDALALKYLGQRTIHFEDLAGKGAKQLSFNQIPIEQAAPYAAEDADVCLKLHNTLWPRLRSDPRQSDLYRHIEVPLIPVLSRIERNGVRIDAGLLETQSRELAGQLQTIQAQAFDVAGEEFNLASPKQIQTILFDKLGLPVKSKTPKGQPSTAESVLQELALDYPLPKLILEYRGLSKLKSTYTDKLPGQINPASGRVHTSYHQAVAATGRLSSSDPNLQNIPIRTTQGRRIRQAFIAPPGHTLLAADYSQIELRIMAHLSQDPGLLEAFATGADVHKATAAEVFATSVEQVNLEQRRAAKAINFGLIYGMSAFGLARQLGITRGDAQEYIERYFQRYPKVREFMDTTRAEAHEQGHVQTVFGRRLYLPEINSRNAQRRQYAERTAINAPMQGTAADIIKRSMIAIDEWLQSDRAVDARIIMQVHDELVLEVADGAVQTVKEAVTEYMGAAAKLTVPLLVDVGIGPNWDEAH